MSLVTYAMSKISLGSITYACKLIVQNILYVATIYRQSIVLTLGYFMIVILPYGNVFHSLGCLPTYVLLWPFKSNWHRLCPSHASLPFSLPLMLFAFYLPMRVNFARPFIGHTTIQSWTYWFFTLNFPTMFLWFSEAIALLRQLLLTPSHMLSG